MKNQNEKSSLARNASIITLAVIVPLWLFYISIRYRENMSTITEKDKELEQYLAR